MFKRLLLLSLSVISINAYAFANAEVQVYGSNTPVNAQLKPENRFQYGIQNNTYQTQTYLVTYSLCATNQPCAVKSEKITLLSTQRTSKNTYLDYGIIYRNKGNFTLSGQIKIEGESSDTKYHSAPIRVNL